MKIWARHVKLANRQAGCPTSPGLIRTKVLNGFLEVGLETTAGTKIDKAFDRFEKFGIQNTFWLQRAMA